MQFSTWGLPYEKACELITGLKAEGIEANITTGGVSMYPEEHQIPRFYEICKIYDATPVLGNTLSEERILNPAKANKWINDRARSQHGVELGLPEN
jgi:hypothetical protein